MKQKGGGGHEMEDADEGDVDHLVETCTIHQGSGLILERKDHLVHLDGLLLLLLLRVWLTRMMWTRQRSSPPRKI